MKDSWNEKRELWMLGDLNINTLSERANSSVVLDDLCKFYGFHKLIAQCTRPYKRHAFCIDNILTDYNNEVSCGALNLLVNNKFCEWLVEADWDNFYEIEDPSDTWDFIRKHIETYRKMQLGLF